MILCFYVVKVAIGKARIFSIEKLCDEKDAPKKRLEASNINKKIVFQIENKLKEKLDVATKILF